MKNSREPVNKRMILADPNMILSVIVPETVQRKAEEWQRGTRISLQQKLSPSYSQTSSSDKSCNSDGTNATNSLRAGVSDDDVEFRKLFRQTPADTHPSQNLSQKKDEADISDNGNNANPNHAKCKPAIRKSSKKCSLSQNPSVNCESNGDLNLTTFTSFITPVNALYPTSDLKVHAPNTYSAISCNENKYSFQHSRIATEPAGNGWYKTRTRSSYNSSAELVTCFSLDINNTVTNKNVLNECKIRRTVSRCKKTKKPASCSELFDVCAGHDKAPCPLFDVSAVNDNVPCPLLDVSAGHDQVPCPSGRDPRLENGGYRTREGLRPRVTPGCTLSSRATALFRSEMRLRDRNWPTPSLQPDLGQVSSRSSCNGVRKRESQRAEPLRATTSSSWSREALCSQEKLKGASEESGYETRRADVIVGLCQAARESISDDLLDLSVEETVDFFLNMVSPLCGPSPTRPFTRTPAVTVVDANLRPSDSSFAL